MKANIDTYVLGIRGGKGKSDRNKGAITVYVDEKGSISTDAFSGYGASYTRRKECLIEINNDKIVVWEGTFEELIKQLIPNEEVILLKKQLQGAKEDLETSITWSRNDFEHLANQNPDTEYDPEKYEDALERMIYKHDASIGISWDTVQDCLDQYCLKITEEDFNE